MKIVCIKKYVSQGLQLELTYGKTYDVIPWSKPLVDLGYNDKYYQVINDRHWREYYDKSDFVTLEEWRSNIINKVLDENSLYYK